MKELEIAPPTAVKVKRGKVKTTFVEHEQTDTAVEVFHTPKCNPKELEALLNREAPLERVVVRCNRDTKTWHLFRDGLPYKQLDALILTDVSFSCEWKKGVYQGCGHYSNGSYTGFASGNLLPVATPLTVPTKNVVHLGFDPGTGRFFNSDTLEQLHGAGYLILKEGCSSEYVNSKAIGAKGKE